MNDLLYLTHRIPYPPNKGDKIRSFHLLRGLAERWNVHLGTFIDDDEDWQHVPVLEELCSETKFIKLNPATAKIRAMRGLFGGTSLTMPYYQDRALKQWVCDIANRRNIECVVAFSSPMAQYLESLSDPAIRTVVDFCDIDSDKWRQYSERFSGVRRWVYRREANTLCREEASIAANCDASVLISDEETTIFCDRTGTPSAKVHTVRNGVDVEYFDPDLAFSDPFSDRQNAIVFVGAMDYWPNVDAVCWFAEEIFPGIRLRNNKATFYIVGSNPDPDVRQLDRLPGVTVTGRVDDVRPYVRHAACVVAPLRVARGVQNKVLEAMAMARPIVVSGDAIEGISFDDDSGIYVCESNASWTDQVLTVMESRESTQGVPGGRRHVSERFSWEASGRDLANIVNGASPR